MQVAEIKPLFNSNDLSRFLGGQTGQTFSHSLKAKVTYWKNRIHNIIEPKIVYQFKEVDKVSKGSISLKEDCLFKSPKLSKTLSNSKEIVCFLATVGTRIEKEISKLFKKNHLADAYILDAMGSAAVENLVEQFQSGISEKFNKKGKTTTLRFSPGYCDWPVTEQKKLFNLLGSLDVDVKLNDSCLMTPSKSISGVFGIQSEYENGEKPYNPCWDCNKTDCLERRSPKIERKKT